MTSALSRIEARHLARSPLLWLGILLGAASMAPALWSTWPVLAGDDLLASQSSLLVGAGAVWAGAWLALRDRASGAADLLTVTPTAPWRLWPARLAALAGMTAAAFALLFAAVLGVSAARGGRGMPDLRLLADGMLAVVLSGLVGVAIGRSSASRLAAVLAGVVWYLVCMFAADPGMSPAYRLSPMLMMEGPRSAEFGLLPDPLWPHLGYLLGLVLVVGVLVVALAARGDGQRPPLAPMVVAVVAGLVLAGAGGTRLVALPEALVALGPDRAHWKPAAEADLILDDPSYVYPQDGRASSCAQDAALSVCVYPAYGRRLALHMHQALQPVAGLLADLPGTPTRVRMVPVTMMGCRRAGEVQIWEQILRDLQPRRIVGAYLTCALGQSDEPDQPSSSALDARDVVKLWALVASGTVTQQELQRVSEQDLWELQVGGERPSAAVTPALAMAKRPVEQVRAELAPLWGRLRAGTLSVPELPGQRP
jgi:hypothetical protein